jgi:hypothetical protein
MSQAFLTLALKKKICLRAYIWGQLRSESDSEEAARLRIIKPVVQWAASEFTYVLELFSILEAEDM